MVLPISHFSPVHPFKQPNVHFPVSRSHGPWQFLGQDSLHTWPKCDGGHPTNRSGNKYLSNFLFFFQSRCNALNSVFSVILCLLWKQMPKSSYWIDIAFWKQKYNCRYKYKTTMCYLHENKNRNHRNKGYLFRLHDFLFPEKMKRWVF